MTIHKKPLSTTNFNADYSSRNLIGSRKIEIWFRARFTVFWKFCFSYAFDWNLALQWNNWWRQFRSENCRFCSETVTATEKPGQKIIAGTTCKMVSNINFSLDIFCDFRIKEYRPIWYFYVHQKRTVSIISRSMYWSCVIISTHNVGFYLTLKNIVCAGSCFIRTDQLDGETDWKLRIALPACQSLHSDHVRKLELQLNLSLQMSFKYRHLSNTDISLFRTPLYNQNLSNSNTSLIRTPL